MSGQPKRGGWKLRRRFIVALLVAVLLPVWYVLTLGPVVWLYTHGYFPYPGRGRELVQVYAAPLLAIPEPVSSWVEAYLDLWRR